MSEFGQILNLFLLSIFKFLSFSRFGSITQSYKTEVVKKPIVTDRLNVTSQLVDSVWFWVNLIIFLTKTFCNTSERSAKLSINSDKFKAGLQVQKNKMSVVCA